MQKLPNDLYREEKNRIVCLLCYRKCGIKPGEKGFCRNRIAEWENGNLIPVFRQVERLEAFNVDPIEKKPLYHFYPGRDVVSVGLRGCNMHCFFCQNYQLSQDRTPLKYQKEETGEWSKEILHVLERENQAGKMVPGIAFTYSEPITWFEFMYPVAKELDRHNYFSVIVSNGMLTEPALKRIIPLLQGANIDIKSLDGEVYKRLGGERDTVKHAVERLFEAGVHVELTYLVVTGLNDNDSQINEFIDWVSELDREIPVHFSRYFPSYKASEPSTPVQKLKDIYIRSTEKLAHVYLGNLGEKAYQTTYCPSCGAVVIERSLFSVRTNLKEGVCSKCGRKLAGIFE